MMHLPGLNLLERLCALGSGAQPAHQSGGGEGAALADRVHRGQPQRSGGRYVTDHEPEPPSMQLERIFHQPAYGEEE